MGLFISLIAIVILIIISIIGAVFEPLHLVFGIIIPYLALAFFLFATIFRIIKWARSPVPFRIPTTAGQQKSLDWIKQNKLDNPSSLLGVLGRMILEVLLFRSLFRNTKFKLEQTKTLTYRTDKWLWLFALLFHWSLLIIVLRHFRYFTEPVLFFVPFLQEIDGLFQIGIPIVYITNYTIIIALLFLFLRRIINQQIRYISLASDYFPLLLIFSIAITGVLIRYFFKTDLVAVKDIAVGILCFHPPELEKFNEVGILFYTHFFLVCCLLIYIPISKLMHFGGILMSPTRNLANNNRMKHYNNPSKNILKEEMYTLKYHTYQEYEDEFRDVMKNSGLPTDKPEE